VKMRQGYNYELPRSRPGCIQTLASFIHKGSLPLKLLAFFLYYLTGILYYTKAEGWTVVQAAYFITVTITTCGYGYFHPTSDGSKVFTIFYIFFGLIIVLTVISGLVNSVLHDAQEGIVRAMHSVINPIFLGGNSQLGDSTLRVYKVQLSLIGIFILLLVGTLFFSGNEDWDLIDSIYWTVCTMTTVGYGDLTIKYESSRIFAIFFILTCVLIYTAAVSNIIDVYIESMDSAALAVEQANRGCYEEFDLKFSDDWAHKIFPDGSGDSINRDKVILLALVELGIIDHKSDIKPLIKVSEYCTLHLMNCVIL
jgi:Ion channel